VQNRASYSSERYRIVDLVNKLFVRANMAVLDQEPFQLESQALFKMLHAFDRAERPKCSCLMGADHEKP